MQTSNSKDLGTRQKLIVWFVVFGVALNALVIILGTLFDLLVFRQRARGVDIAIGVPLITGLTLLYLSRLLARRKHAAWLIAIPVFAFVLLFNLLELVMRRHSHYEVITIIRNIVLPIVVVIGLSVSEKQFTVRSDIRSFGSSLRFIVLVLAITLFYGVIGFQLLDKHDFHQEIGWENAFHYTIDQFDLTTKKPLVPYTHRAVLFVDSLSIISIGAVAYGLVSLFQPIKARFVDQSHNRSIMRALLERYPANSEDFFKLWPHDKVYFINYETTAGLAFHVRKGIALVIGDLAGDVSVFPSLLKQFEELCYVNDWTPAIVHSEAKYNPLYESNGYTMQKLGEEAIVNIEHFQSNVANNKHFRNITNKFSKAGYTSEILLPPHNHEIVARLRKISQEWLQAPGREERGLIMGYFTNAYVQQCPVMVVKDKEGKIKAFLNQIHSFSEEEANFDMLRHSKDSMGNINDFLLVQFIEYLASRGFKRLNMGLCPLSGLKEGEDKTIVDNVLSFAYTNGDRIYSFSGLRRFKAKYEPDWSARYMAYRGGIPGLTRTYSALNGAWKVHFRN